MILTFRFISDEEESFVIDVNINHDQTFEQLHDIIQEKLDYDPAQLASFFTSNENWEKLEEITLVDMGGDQPVHTMTETTVGEFFDKKNQHLLYVYDYFAERLFFGSVTRIFDAKSPVDLPTVSRLEGRIPIQMATSNPVDDDILPEMTSFGDDFTFEGDYPENMEDLFTSEENDY